MARPRRWRAPASARRGATAYVSLEPCCHRGKTPPCADALIAAGIARVVVPIEDPDPRVAGKGIARLRAAGIAVEIGLWRGEAAEVNAGFLLRLARGPAAGHAEARDHARRPHRHLDRRKPLDHRRSRARRARISCARRHDAVMVGSNTALADDPLLTCRLPGSSAAARCGSSSMAGCACRLTARVVAEARTSCRPGSGRAAARDAGAAPGLRRCGVELIEAARAPTGELDLADGARRSSAGAA